VANSFMNFRNSKIKKENGRDTCRATPVVLRHPYLHRRERYEEEDRDQDHVVHRMIRGANHHCLIFGSPVAHRFYVSVKRAFILVPVEKSGNDERESAREWNTDQAVNESELDRLLDDRAPLIVPLTENPLLVSCQEREYEHESDEE